MTGTIADDERTVLAAEEARCRALMASDMPALERMFSDRLRYTHASGVRDTKAEYLAKIQNGYYDYIRITHRVEQVDVLGDTAVVVGRLSGDMTVQGDPRILDTLTTAVWTRSSGEWQLLAHGSTGSRKD